MLAPRVNSYVQDYTMETERWCGVSVPTARRQYWADLKYKTRRKSAAGGALGDLSSAEERLQNILGTKTESTTGQTRESQSDADEDRKPALDDDMYSEGSAGADGARLSTEELLAEAAMRSALAAEKQAEAVSQAVELLRELLAVLRDRAPFPPHPHAHAHQPLAPHAAPAPPDHTLGMQQHHHHRL
ncbi:uncharacterized protein [Epargyreus clarus]|uniref:uncharacterized protein isoform X2 n=1 Tax=Epargyreus clarus TaxID=520877 RepID=UPI003C2F101C